MAISASVGNSLLEPLNVPDVIFCLLIHSCCWTCKQPPLQTGYWLWANRMCSVLFPRASGSNSITSPRQDAVHGKSSNIIKLICRSRQVVGEDCSVIS